jgi:adenylate cyclase
VAPLSRRQDGQLALRAGKCPSGRGVSGRSEGTGADRSQGVRPRPARPVRRTLPEKIGTREGGAPPRRVIDSSKSTVDTATNPDGSLQYELYVPVSDEAGHLRAVFELYEPVTYLNAVLLRAALPALAVPGLLLLAVGLALDRLVVRAQTDIDARTNALNALRHRIETFVSDSAVSAARAAQGNETIRSKKISVALLYSDICYFTAFAEANPAEKVVDFLNDVMSLQVEVITDHGGDVDKMIGDAVLARFDGRSGGKRAVAAACGILARVARAGYPRGFGIGVLRGQVILGAVAPRTARISP